MLVLTRRVGETVVIGDEGEVRVVVLGIQGKSIRIGFLADKDIPIQREEIYDRLVNEELRKELATRD